MVTFLAAVVIFYNLGIVDAKVAAAVCAGGALVAGVGAIDDHYPLPPLIRALSHFGAAAIAIWKLQGVPPLFLGCAIWEWGWLGSGVAVVGIVWMINLYNFMDGIDGLAGVEGLCVGGFGAMLLFRNGLSSAALLACTLAAACAGFLVWNWPPARVFMGDAGSGFLGFVFAVLALATSKDTPWFLWIWLILLMAFLTDSTVTLLRRFREGARLYEAHRSHAYQNAVRHYGSHRRVTLFIAGLNSCWLLPMALVVSIWPYSAPVIAVLAVIPVIWMTLAFGAGKQQPRCDINAISM